MARAEADPTRTLTLRDRFAGQMYTRFRDLKGLIRDLIESGQLPTGPNHAATIRRFEDWLRRQENEVVLGHEVRPATPPPRSWMREFLREGYAQGVQRTRAQLRQRGAMPEQGEAGPGAGTAAGVAGVAVILALPGHEEELDLLHDRAFRDLVSILEAQDADLVRNLTDALEGDLSNRELANRLTERVDKVGIYRGRLLARTAIVRAHAEGQLEEMQRLGVEEVTGEAELEFMTAGDHRVCPRCRALEGNRYTIREARGVIPVHPSCRCAWVPVLD